MPPLIAVAIIGAGAYMGYRAARHFLSRGSSGAAPEGAGEPEAAEKDLGALEYDPVTGSYRPARRS